MKNLILLCLLFFVGCGTSPLLLVPAGINVILFWKNGVATKYYTGDKEDITEKLKTVITSFSHSIEEQNDKITSKSENHIFHWEVKQVDKKVCKITCRIDTFGDKEYAELIFKKLDSTLGLKTSKIIDESTDRKWLHRIKQ